MKTKEIFEDVVFPAVAITAIIAAELAFMSLAYHGHLLGIIASFAFPVVTAIVTAKILDR